MLRGFGFGASRTPILALVTVRWILSDGFVLKNGNDGPAVGKNIAAHKSIFEVER